MSNPIKKIGDCEVGQIPKIVGVVGGEEALSLAEIAKEEGADILEARMDLYNTTDLNKINCSLEGIRSATNLPIIGTIRRIEEGGLFVGTEEMRKKLFLETIDNIDAIDIELFVEKRVSDEIIDEAVRGNKTIIVSHHDYYGTPGIDDLNKIVEDAASMKRMDILKIAVMAKTIEDVIRLLNFTIDCPIKPLCTISMGDIGKISRIAFPFFGSCLTYGSAGITVAPGQIHVKHLKYVLGQFSPDAQLSVESIEKLCKKFAA